MQLKDHVESTLSAGVDASTTSWPLVDASSFPDPADGQYWVRIWNSSRYSDPQNDPDTEEARVTAKVTNTLTVVRGEDGETGAAHNESGQVYTVAMMAGGRNVESANWYNVLSFGADPTGATDSTAAVAAAVTAASGGKLVFPEGTYLIDSLDLTNNPPEIVDAKDAILKARITTANPLVSVENPHSTVKSFRLSVGLIDGDSKATYGLKIKGGQNMNIQVRIENATSHGAYLEVDSGFGIFYSTFLFFCRNNDGDGVHLGTIEGIPLNRNAANRYMGQCDNNLGDGWSMNYAQNAFIGCGSEFNNGYGFNVDNCFANDFIGGYSENNHQNKAQGGADDLSSDESFNITSAALRVKILGGRHIGSVTSAASGVGELILPSAAAQDNFRFPPSGNLQIPGSLQTGTGGVGVGASPIGNALNLSADGSGYGNLYVKGTRVVRLRDTDKAVRMEGYVEMGASGPKISVGTGVPAAADPDGSIFLRTDGGSGTTLYVRESGIWVAK